MTKITITNKDKPTPSEPEALKPGMMFVHNDDSDAIYIISHADSTESNEYILACLDGVPYSSGPEDEIEKVFEGDRDHFTLIKSIDIQYSTRTVIHTQL